MTAGCPLPRAPGPRLLTGEQRRQHLVKDKAGQLEAEAGGMATLAFETYPHSGLTSGSMDLRLVSLGSGKNCEGELETLL